MSFYRKHHWTISAFGERVTQRPASVEEEPLEILFGKQITAAPVLPPPPEIIKLRKASSATILLPRSRAWLDQLPEEIRPNHLARDFPRIANRLCADWGEPDAWRLFTRQLMSDRRGTREGFPPLALNELHRLLFYYSKLHPQGGNAWEWELKSAAEDADGSDVAG